MCERCVPLCVLVESVHGPVVGSNPQVFVLCVPVCVCVRARAGGSRTICMWARAHNLCCVLVYFWKEGGNEDNLTWLTKGTGNEVCLYFNSTG